MHRKYITGELFTETYCFCLLYEYLVSLSLLSLFLCSHLLPHWQTFPLSLPMEITPWPCKRTPLTITMELNGNQSIISALLGRGLVDAFSRSMALHVAHGAPFRGHNEHSVDKLGQLRLFLAKQLSTSPPSSLCLFTLHPDTNTRKLHRDDCKNILTSPYASCHCH